MSRVVKLPRSNKHPTGYDNNVPADHIVRWMWDYDAGHCRVVLSDGSSITTSLRPEEIEQRYNEARKS